jgi:hypothetical protein
MTPRLAVGLTFVNLVLMLMLVAPMRPLTAQDVTPVLRGRALEIVDDRGLVRARISVDRSNDTDATVLLSLMSGTSGANDGPAVHLETSRDGSGLRLIMGDPRGAPGVKLEANRNSAGLRLGDGLETGIDVTAKASGNFMRVANPDGRQLLVQP